MNVFVSSTTGLIAQMYVFLTRQRYQYACVFLDHNYDLTYVHLLKFQTVYKAVETKEAFDAYAESHGVDIKHYHAENGIFRSEKWMKQCKDMHQDLNFSGFNAHHQNGLLKWHIR